MYSRSGRTGKVVLPVEQQWCGGRFFIQHRNLAQYAGLGGRQRQRCVFHRLAATGFPIVQAVDLGTAQPQQFGEAVGRVPQTAEVALIHHTGPLADHHRTAGTGKVTEPGGEVLPQQVKHRHHHQAVAGQVCILADQIHRDAGTGQGIVMASQFLPIAHATVAGAAGPFHSPEIGPIMDQGRLPGPLTSRRTGQFLQRGAYLGGFSEDSGIGAAIMPHHRTVEFFLCTTVGTPLEVADTVRPVGHCLQGAEHRYAGLFLFGHRLPVGKARAGLHHQERLAFQGVEQVMHHGGIQRGLFHRLGGLVPGGIVVPADYIQLSGQVMVVDIVEAVHKVGGKPSLGG